MSQGASPIQQRHVFELALLKQFFPGMTRSAATNGTRLYPEHIDLPMTTQSGGRYTLRLVIPNAFPDTMPAMLVVSPRPLLDRSGNPLLSVSAMMHVLGARDGYTNLCHFQSDLWEASFSLHLVAMKGRIWLEAYEGHLKSGETIDHWLPHMTKSRIPAVEPGRAGATAPRRPPADAPAARAPAPPPTAPVATPDQRLAAARPAPVPPPPRGLQKLQALLARIFG